MGKMTDWIQAQDETTGEDRDAVIRRQRAEIETLRSKIERWKTAYAMCDRSRDRFVAEIERLRSENDEMRANLREGRE